MFISFHGNNELRIENATKEFMDELGREVFGMWPDGVVLDELPEKTHWRVRFRNAPWSLREKKLKWYAALIWTWSKYLLSGLSEDRENAGQAFRILWRASTSPLSLSANTSHHNLGACMRHWYPTCGMYTYGLEPLAIHSYTNCSIYTGYSFIVRSLPTIYLQFFPRYLLEQRADLHHDRSSEGGFPANISSSSNIEVWYYHQRTEHLESSGWVPAAAVVQSNHDWSLWSWHF